MFVKDYYDVYPDLKDILSIPGSSVSYIRGDVSLKMSALLYDKTIVYLPPWPQNLIEKRFGISYKEFLSLCQNNIIIPIIGDPHDYSAEYFQPLFKLKIQPPSLWARGIALLDIFGIGNVLDVARQKIPVDQIACTPEIQKKWSERLPYADENTRKQAIMNDISVMYADMCIFGYEHEAQEMGKFLDPQKAYESLQVFNEAITYPVLFGLNSRPTYNPDKLENSLSKLYINPQFNIPPIPIPPDLEVLLQGIGIDIETITLEDIIKYRQDGLGVALREALRSFEDYCNNGLNGENLLDRDSILERAEKFQKQIRTAIGELTPQKYKEFNMIEKCITTSIKIGGFGVGGVLGYTIDGGIATVAGISGFSGAVLSEILTYPKAQEAVNWVVEACLSHKNSKYMVNLWKCKKMIG